MTNCSGQRRRTAVGAAGLNGCFLLEVDGLNAERSKPNRVELSVRSGLDLGFMGYFVSMRIGFPPQTQGNQSITLQHCFNFTTGYNEALISKLAIHFDNRAKFEPLVKSYVVGDDVKCLGFVRSDGVSASIIGNLLQQSHIWEFDLFNEKVKIHSFHMYI
ncbi:hypothetical protein V6N13_023460 [Hibiscus sabdariffa]|uniref:Xylanase inhibitor C-terminal domain-containing protein n=1 Tax=Hibiscus sabdariffa TaxID=183260 RepID=A0ABR2PLQ1_9ROSI